MILSGRDALKVVAEKEGRWNWVLVGPNADTLPLVGGGSGGVDQMRDCLAQQEVEQKAEKQFANFYGLLRLRFGTGRMGRTKYVFVQASRVDERAEEGGEEPSPTSGDNPKSLKRGNTMSAVRHGQAMGQRGAMEKALLEFVHFAAKIEATSLDDLTVSNVVEKVQKVSTADADLLSMETYQVALEEFQKAHPEESAPVVPESVSVTNVQALTAACAAEIFDKECAPSAEAAEAQPVQEEDDGALIEKFSTAKTSAPDESTSPVDDKAEEKSAPVESGKTAESGKVADAAPEVPAAQTKPAEPSEVKMKRGDLLFVYSNAAKQWMDDGIVVAVLQEAGEHDGLSLPKESVKVQYNNRRQFKWVTPLQLKQYVKPSKRPVPPPTLLGELLKETHNWISQWHVRYFELSKGYLQWWMTSDEAKNGVVPNGSLSLTGLEMTVKDTVMYIRTATSKGIIYAFDATTTESVSKWSEMMKEHEEYCRKMQTYLTQRATETEQAEKGQAKEKFADLTVERKRRASLSQEQTALSG